MDLSSAVTIGLSIELMVKNHYTASTVSTPSINKSYHIFDFLLLSS